ncbi:hypothetical protein H4R18_004362 [Coemansia javaensis]|uniref:[Histone H3]-trimethyl-L-lysine(9) demethylase n=1 Tax=Coemansia javaensis TaxID=2761396 RepID=A0A9W8LGC8_9FUNG|nr:hypothetical protein H4R18_004362 [Coemansia javaensis]
MHGRRAGETAVAGAQPQPQQQQQQQQQHQQPRQSQLRAADAEAAGDVLRPQVCGQAVEYYFYPNSMVPVFCPTMDQFRDFEALVTAIEPLAVRAGVCKVIPPQEWRRELERRNRRHHRHHSGSGQSPVRVFADDEFPIMRPIVQHFNGSSGIFHQYNVEFHRRLRLAQFFQTSQDASHRQPELKLPGDGEAKEQQDSSSSNNNSSNNGNNNGTAETNDNDDDDRDDDDDDDDDDDTTAALAVESDTIGVAVDYEAGEVRLTTAAAAALRDAVRSEAQRAQFRPAVSRYRPQPDTRGAAAADHMGVRPERRFAEDGRALFVSEREYAANEELERMYWKNMLFQPPMYGADVLGTLFPPPGEFPAWNIRNLPGLLRQIGQRMPGVNDPYLYLGMWKATFAWHVEDMDLYSINYIHFGEPKAWYAIPIAARSRFEVSMQNVFAGDYKNCSQFLRHKSFLLSPRFLAAQGIPFNRVVQRAGEIVLTFPLGYHAGFNHGFNCAESVNFALDRWLDVAWDSKHCECVKDSVTIDLMEWFGDARKARQKQQQQQQQQLKHVPPRRHAAAAVAIAAAADDGPQPGGGGGGGGGGPSAKRRPSAAPEPEPGAKRAPQQGRSKPVAARAAPGGGDEDLDARRRFASLRTPAGACGACLADIREFDAAEETAEVVECAQCGLTVHAQCSALAYYDADGGYRCANCEMDTDQLACALCAVQNGLLLPVKTASSAADGARPPEFAHFLCAAFVSETYFDFPDAPDADESTTTSSKQQQQQRIGTRSRSHKPAAAASTTSSGLMPSSAKVCGIGDIAKSRFTAKCIHCAGPGGQCFGPVVQCAHAKCFRSFHPMCAAIRNPALLNWTAYAAYCPAHQPPSMSHTA